MLFVISNILIFSKQDYEGSIFFTIGKTMAYLLPLIHHLREPRNKRGFRGVIVAPTRELASQIFRECQKLSEPRKLRPFIMDNAAKSAKKISGQKLDILITTPNRLVYMIENQSVSLKNVEWLIVDESDKLFETTGKGEKSFRDQLAIIHRYSMIRSFSENLNLLL